MTMIHKTRLIVTACITFMTTAPLLQAVAQQAETTPVVTGNKPVQVAPVQIGADPAELDNSDGVVDVLVGLWNQIFKENPHQSIISNAPNPEYISNQRRSHVKKGRSTGLPVPRFVSLGDKANLRKGPGQQYTIDWILRTQHQPLEIIGEYKKWRQVRDLHGAKGWVFAPILKSRRYVSVSVDEAALYTEKQYDSQIKIRLGKGVILRPDECDRYWCLVETVHMDTGYQGWVRRAHIWGIYQNESLD